MKSANSYLLAVLILGSALGSVAHAAIAQQVTVTGRVISFDDKVVKIFNKGQVSLAPRPAKVRLGDEISVTFDLEQFKKSLR